MRPSFSTLFALFVFLGLTSSTVLGALPPEGATEAEWQSIRIEKYQLKKKSLGVQGYDPVAYFPEGDPKGKGKPTRGSKNISLNYKGVAYRFSSKANRELFKKTPGKYEPAFGGWCAYATGYETFTKPNPKNFKLQDGRLMLFFDSLFTDTHKLWEEEGPEKLESLADAYWNKQTGERPPAKPVSP